MKITKLLTLSAVLGYSANGAPVINPVDSFSSWENLPEIINSITKNDFREQLEQLQCMTLIKLGFPQASLGLSDHEHQLYMLETKERWKGWWQSTGEKLAKIRKTDAIIDAEAFKIAWDFLGQKSDPPTTLLPVWIPTTWTLCVTFTNGDYAGKENEVWMIRRKAAGVNLTKLRGDYARGWPSEWNVVLSEFEGLTPERADQILKALCYTHHYAPPAGAEVSEHKLQKLYYPHATLHLRDGANRILWNTDGYQFSKTRPEFGNGEAGRSYFFLKTVFSNNGKWRTLPSPSSEDLAPYRDLLSASKPYFFTNASDIIQLFGRYGGPAEREAMLEWASKQKAATSAKMDWKVRSSDFQTESQVNVIGLTKLELKETLSEIQRISDRLAVDGKNRKGEPPSDH